MFVNGWEFTHCHVCHDLVKTGGTINRAVSYKTWNKYLLQHSKEKHPDKIDRRDY